MDTDMAAGLEGDDDGQWEDLEEDDEEVLHLLVLEC
jgi:hypothetical protein